MGHGSRRPYEEILATLVSRYVVLVIISLAATPSLSGMPSETAVAICSVLMGGVLERHPKLKVVFAHGGGAYPYIIGRVEHGYNVRPDLCATDNPINPR